MRILVAGGGPVGTFTGMALARRGHEVTLVDRDPGPTPDEGWRRAGVMQFLHPHGYRPAVRRALLAEFPDVYDAMVAAGAVAGLLPGLPEQMTGLFCRRSVFERVLRGAAAEQPGLTWVTGHIDQVAVQDGAVRGLVVDGGALVGDAVIVATGRSSRIGSELRGPVEGGSCGFTYLSRMYRARDGQPGCNLLAPSFVTGPGYVSLVMPQDAGTHSVLVSYPSDAAEFATLRTEAGFEHAARAIPNLAPWTEGPRFEPLTAPLVGGHLTNTYRLQGPALGLPPARGLFFLGDAVCTTNPAAGRGMALGFDHARQLLAVLDDPAQTELDVSLALDLWAEEHIRPWFLDHVRWDRTLLRRFAGDDLDLSERIPSDVICAAATVDPAIAPFAGQYLGMVAGPDVLDPVEDRVRQLLADGWRPTPAGPTRTEISALAAA